MMNKSTFQLEHNRLFSELQDAFIKRALIKIGEDYFVPTGFSVASKIGTVTYAKAGSTAGSAATATLVSVAD